MAFPSNCTLDYVSSFLTESEATDLYNFLFSIEGLTRPIEIELQTGEKYTHNYGKLMLISKKMREENSLPDANWGRTLVWPEEIYWLKERVENYIGHQFDVGVCIYYPDGNSGVDYHSDFSAYGDTTIIPSLSLGEERVFNLREKETLKEYSNVLENGSLIVMGENCQQLYEHSLPLNSKYRNGRINITFRKYGYD